MADTTALPFDRYTGGGRQLLGVPALGDGSSRRGYGRAVFEQCGFACAYCGHAMETAYEVWLALSVDHVIPTGAGRQLGYPPEWIQDIANQVTCCRACNEFLNSYRVTDPPPATVEEFFDLRDRHYLAKREWVQARHATERAWYDAAFERSPPAQAGVRLAAQPMADFALQFPLEQVPEYAARYSYEDDLEVLAIGRTARGRGHYALDEFLRVCRWKTPRSAPLVAQNSADVVEAQTRVALAAATTERQRLEALRSLRGVEWPTASVLLHLAYPERYPILDKRALHALGVRAPPAYSFRFWEAYVTVCLDLAQRAGVDGRTLDQALWQWSKEQGESLY